MTFLRKRLNYLFNILFRPVPRTYQKIALNANGKLGESIIWLMLIGPIRELVNIKEFSLISFFGLIILVPLLILLFVFFLHFFHKKIFRRKKYVYDELLYSTTLIFFATTLIQILLIPLLKSYWIGILTVYQLALITIALKSLTSLKIWQSILSVFFSTLFSFVGVLFIVLLMGVVPTAF